MGLSFVQNAQVPALAQDAKSAGEKLNSALPMELQEQSEVALFSGSSSFGYNLNEAHEPLYFTQLRQAIRAQTYVSLTYQDGEGRESKRDVRPLALVCFEPLWLLVGWCDLRQDFRSFRLDRIQVYEDYGRPFKLEPHQTLKSFMQKESCASLH